MGITHELYCGHPRAEFYRSKRGELRCKACNRGYWVKRVHEREDPPIYKDLARKPW